MKTQLLLLFVCAASVRAADLPAFPGAEGYGSSTPGGRGGKVIEVTNLNDAGPGSLREAVDATGPRIVVFRVSGTIPLTRDLVIRNPNITIAGQTAPGDGICLKNYKLMISANDSVVRYLRVRRGNESGRADDSLGVAEAQRVVVDHCSIGWSMDEALNTWHGSKDITIQWCLVSEALHVRGHGFAATLGGVNASYHHNMIANCPGRNPSVAGNHEFQTRNMDWRNNVHFNWGSRTFDGKPSSINIVNNYFKPGPMSRLKVFARIDAPGAYPQVGIGKWYFSGNLYEGDEAISKDNKSGTTGAQELIVADPNEFAPVKTVSAQEVFPMVLAGVGATLPKRDSVDTRVIDEARTGKTTFGDGTVMDPKDVGGWPELKSAEPPTDSDHDGMPDWWEKKCGLNPNDASDGAKDLAGDGYTNVEKYLNGIDPTKKIDWATPANNVNTLKPGSLDELNAKTP
jgi:pectate lyase